MEQEKLFAIVTDVAAEFEREMERAVRHKDLQQATFALGGKDACHRLRNALEFHDRQVDWQRDADAEYDRRQAAKKARRELQKQIREDDKKKRAAQTPAPEPAPFSPIPVRDQIEHLRRQRAQLLKAIDSRQHQKAG